VALFYTATILRKKRRVGRSPVIRGDKGSLHRLIHDTFAVFRGMILLVCIARVPFPQIDDWLLPFRSLWHPAVTLSGCALMLTSFIAIVWLHTGMGGLWRSGIDAERAGGERLIETGGFAYSRNPIFLCIQGAQLGLFLSLPSAFTAICLIVGVVAIQMQVRLEEHHLAARFGEAWRAYAARVPRWLIS
jgi:protein-S-isoprenylcysteine O-methyltransferase Ste14